MITFNGTNLKNYVKIRNIRRSIMPAREISMLDVRGRSGSYFQNLRHQALSIEADIMIIGTSYEDIRSKTRVVAGLLHSDEPAKLSFHDEPDKYYEAMVADESVLEELAMIGQTTITFICFSPFATSVEQSTFNVLPSDHPDFYSKGEMITDDGIVHIDGEPIFSENGIHMYKRYAGYITDGLLETDGIPDWTVFQNPANPAQVLEVQSGNSKLGIGNTYHVYTLGNSVDPAGIKQNFTPDFGTVDAIRPVVASVWVRGIAALPQMWVVGVDDATITKSNTNVHLDTSLMTPTTDSGWVRISVKFSATSGKTYTLNLGWDTSILPSGFATYIGTGDHKMWFHSPQVETGGLATPLPVDQYREHTSIIVPRAIGQVSNGVGTFEIMFHYDPNQISTSYSDTGDSPNFLIAYGQGTGTYSAALVAYVDNGNQFVATLSNLSAGTEATHTFDALSTFITGKNYICITWESSTPGATTGTSKVYLNGVLKSTSSSSVKVVDSTYDPDTALFGDRLALGSNMDLSRLLRHSWGNAVEQVRFSNQVRGTSDITAANTSGELPSDAFTTSLYDFRTGNIDNLLPDLDAKFVGGTAPTYPKITATFNEDATYYQVGAEDGSINLGDEATPVVIPVPPTMTSQYTTTSGATDKFSSMGAWWINGILGNGSSGISASATASVNSTPAIFPTGSISAVGVPIGYVSRQLALDASQVDFEMSIWMRMNSSNVDRRSIMELRAIDQNGLSVASISVTDRMGSTHYKEFQAQLFMPNGTSKILGSKVYFALVDTQDFQAKLGIKRVNNEWTFYVQPTSGASTVGDPYTITYSDGAKLYSAKIANMHYAFGRFSGFSQHETMNFHNPACVGTGATSTPDTRSFLKGDIIEIDCEFGTLKLNGVDRMDLLDPTSTFIRLMPGRQDGIKAYPTGATETLITYNKRWL